MSDERISVALRLGRAALGSGVRDRRRPKSPIAIEEGCAEHSRHAPSQPATVILDAGDVAIQWTLDITDAGGMMRRMNEERFFHDPAPPIVGRDAG